MINCSRERRTGRYWDMHLHTVAPGGRDVLLQADPLANAVNLRAVEAVLANGRLFDRAALVRP